MCVHVTVREREREKLNTETTKKYLILDAFALKTVRKYINVNPIPNANCHPVWCARQDDDVISLNDWCWLSVRREKITHTQ